MLSPDENPFMTAHKPVEDGFPFVVETDSLADSMGLRLPNRSLYLLQGKVGAGKSLIAQRLIHGMSKTASRSSSSRRSSPPAAGLNKWKALATA